VVHLPVATIAEHGRHVRGWFHFAWHGLTCPVFVDHDYFVTRGLYALFEMV
jgi:hypothetical protein